MVLRLLHRAGSARRNRFGFALIGLALCAAIGFPTYLTTSSTYSRIRVLVATPDAGNVDVLINSIQIAANNKLGDLTTYTYRPSGHFGLRAFPPGVSDPGKALAAHNVAFEGGKDYTVIVYGKKADNTLDIVAEQDTNTLDTANAKVRFANYLPGSTALALSVTGTMGAVANAAFGKTSGAYATIPPTASGASPATLSVTDTSGAGVTSATATLSANIVVSAFAIPGAGGAGATLLLSLDAGTPATPLNPTAATAMSMTATAATAVPTGATTATAAPAATTAPASGGSASAALRAALLPVPQVTNTDTKVWYAATGHTLGGVFKTYWESHGGLEQFGYPITEEYQEVSATDGKTYTTQYFERARFEDHTDKAGTPYEVEQGLLGREMIKLLGAG